MLFWIFVFVVAFFVSAAFLRWFVRIVRNILKRMNIIP